MSRTHIVVAALFILAAPACASIDPHDVVLSIPYGTGPGELDTLRVDADDPHRTLVQSFRVESDGSVWLLPRVEVAGRTVLYVYRNAAFERQIPFTGYPGGFLSTPEGVYSWGPGGHHSIAALVAFDAGPGRGQVRRSTLSAAPLTPAGFSGWMEMAGGSPCLLGQGAGGTHFTLRLPEGLPSTELDGADRGIAITGRADPIWQDNMLIMRGDDAVYDLWDGAGPERAQGTLVAALPDGGFVIRRIGEPDGGTINPVFELHGPDGALIRRVVTLPRTDHFSLGTSPWFFTDTHVYQLTLGPLEGRLVRY